ncbi:AAA family ATPase [Chryseobacterium indologenes]
MKTKAIYGANSSGKSNIIKAITVFINIVKNSVIDKTILNKVDRYKYSSKFQELPSFFQLVFWDENVRYRYGFEVSKDEVSAEWLYHKPNKREEPLFIRDGQKLIEVNKKNFREGSVIQRFMSLDEVGSTLFRPNAVILTTLSTFGCAKVFF